MSSVERSNDDNTKVNIIGAGLAGLSAAITLSRKGIPCNLISAMPSERAQSVLAEGGINGAVDTMGENDTPMEHYEDTMKAGCYIANAAAVMGLTTAAPGILNELLHLGVPFNTSDGKIVLRNFGGQKKKRTAYAKSSTGKALMTALIDEARKYEARKIITRYSHHEFVKLILTENSERSDEREKERKGECSGACIRDIYTGSIITVYGPVILATGGMNGLFPGMTTGTVTNSADAAAELFCQGVEFSNLEMIQYHPTTIQISGKRCLISEAARGEGGRLYIMRNEKPWYFMEDRYPELGNLSPRDVVSREMYFVSHNSDCDEQVYLDMRHLSAQIWSERLPDLRAELIHYLGLDPEKKPVPVEPGIHYFMGGIHVDVHHRTNFYNLYAAGECCSQYHGANRLGGNSTLGAIYGGMVAAEDLAELLKCGKINLCTERSDKSDQLMTQEKTTDFDKEVLVRDESNVTANILSGIGYGTLSNEISQLLAESMGIVRTEKSLAEAINGLNKLIDFRVEINSSDMNRLMLAKAMLLCADYRKESRGAHYREDYPKQNDAYQGMIKCKLDQKTRGIVLKLL